VKDFDEDVVNNLYKLCNRLLSGSYMPPAVRQVLEPIVGRLFHEDSYGYQPGKSAREVLAQTRQRCWKYA